MARWGTYLDHLQTLWEDAGLSLGDFPSVEDTNPFEIIEEVKNQLDILPQGLASSIQTQIQALEPELNRLSNTPDAGNLFFQRPHAGITREVAGARQQASTLRDDMGRRITSGPEEITFKRAITAEDLPALPEDFEQQWGALHDEVEDILRGRQGKQYLEDPFNTRISKLLPGEKEKYLRKYNDLLGIPHLLENDLGPEMFKPTINPLTGLVERSPAGRFVIAASEFMKENIDPRLLILSQQTIRLDPRMIGRAESPIEQYGIAGRTISPAAVDRIKETLQADIARPSNTLVFDVESAGLDPDNGIWQLSARMVDERGAVVRNDAGDEMIKTFHFKNAAMQHYGEIGQNRQSLEKFLSEGSTLADYPEGLTDFFSMVKEADAVAGHNIFFDYGMISHGLKKHALYHADTPAGQEFREGVDHFISKFYDLQNDQVGRVFDTATISRALLGDKLTLAPELVGTESPQRFSLQNILLETDLLERVRAAEGDETVDAWLRRGLHFADVDVPVESHLLAALREQAAGTGPGLRVVRSLTGEWRERVLRSRAIGPTIEMSDLKTQVNDELVERMLRASTGPNPLIQFDTKTLEDKGYGGVEDLLMRGITTKEDLEEAGVLGDIRRIRLTPMEQKVVMSRDYSLPIDERPLIQPGAPFWGQVRDIIKNPREDLWKKLKATFWEPQTISGRTAEQMGYSAGTWERLSEDFTTRAGLLRRGADLPSAERWEEIQDSLAKAGMPFAHASLMERHLMATLSSRATQQSSALTRDVQRILGPDIAPVARWVESEIGITSERSQITKLPERVLIEAERAGVFNLVEDSTKARTAFGSDFMPQFYSVSPFRYTSRGREAHEVGLMFRFGEGAQGAQEKRELYKFLQGKAGTEGYESLTPTLLDRVRQSIFNNSDEYGIQVASLTGFQDQSLAKRVFSAIAQVQGGTVDRSNLQVQVARAASEERGVVKTAGAFLTTELLDSDQLKGIAWHVGQASRISREAYNLARNDRVMEMFGRIANSAEGIDTPIKMANAYFKVEKRGPLLALGAAILGGGYYLNKRRRAQREYDQTFDFQPEEDEGYYNQYQRDVKNSHIPSTQIGGTRPSTNPLDTAALMQGLDRRKTNHQQMGNNKYGYLFSKGYS